VTIISQHFVLCFLNDCMTDDLVGFLCGQCPHGNNEGSALNLAECVSCEAWSVAVFILICKLYT